LNQFQAARLIPFQFSTLQAYALLFGDYSMKVIMNGGFVIDHSPASSTCSRRRTLGAELAAIKFVQSADVMTLCHPNHAPFNLTRTAHDAWTLRCGFVRADAREADGRRGNREHAGPERDTRIR
jgi:hypothetical protein